VTFLESKNYVALKKYFFPIAANRISFLFNSVAVILPSSKLDK